MKSIPIILLLVLFSTSFYAQQILLKECISDSKFPEVYWYTKGEVDTVDFKVFRKGADDEKFNEIFTPHWVKRPETGDTTEIVVIDTSLTETGLYHYYVQVMMNDKKISSQIGNGHNFGALPRPALLTFTGNPLKDKKGIKLEWKFNYNKTINYVSIYRSDDYDKGYEKIAELDNEEFYYIDHVPLANEAWFYYMIIHDYYGDQLPSVRIPAFATFKEKPMSPYNLKNRISNDSVYLEWENIGSNIIGYRVYRSIDDNAFYLMDDMVYNRESKSKFFDASPETKDAINLQYYVLNVSDGFVESLPSDTVFHYFAEHEKVFPPKTLDRIIHDDRRVELLWVPPDEGLILGYNVFITDPDGQTKKLNELPLKLNHYTDTGFRPPGEYSYAVEGVGYKNKISDRRASTLVKQYPLNINVILDLMRVKDGVRISWKHSLNKHIKKVILYRKAEKDVQAIALREFPGNEDVEFLDKDSTNGQLYIYILKGVMSDDSIITLNRGVDIYL